MTKKKTPPEWLGKMNADLGSSMEAAFDWALWGTCIYCCKSILDNPTANMAGKRVAFDPGAVWFLSGFLGPFAPFIPFTPEKEAKINAEVKDLTDGQKWQLAFIAGTLAYGTLRYAGSSIVDGVFGAAGSAFKAVGIVI